jgi:hypothetical protein
VRQSQGRSGQGVQVEVELAHRLDLGLEVQQLPGERGLCLKPGGARNAGAHDWVTEDSVEEVGEGNRLAALVGPSDSPIKDLY